MAHTFSYMFAKNLCKRALLVQITRLVDIVNSVEFTISTKRIELNYYRIKVKGHVQFCNAVTMATHKSPKLHQRQIVQKSCWPPILRPLKISPPKVDKPTYGTELYHHANLHADRRGISVRGKNTYFPYRGLPWGGYRSMLYIFGKLLSSQCYDPFDMFSRYSRSKFGSLWSIGGTPKGRPGSTIIPNFTPIVLTVAEISVTGHKKLLPI